MSTDLEIGLRQWAGGSYSVDMCFTASTLGGELRPEGDTDQLAHFNDQALKDLLALAARPKDYGKVLSKILFRDDALRQLFRDAHNHANAKGDPLRVRLRLGRGTTPLHGLLWETLLDPEDDSPLASSGRVYFSRYLSSAAWRPAQPPWRGPPRVLLAVANPKGLVDVNVEGRDLTKIDVAGEVKRVEDAFGGARAVPFTRLADPGAATLAKLAGALGHGCDVLYLVCHGALFDEGAILWLEDDQGDIARVPGRELVKLFRSLDRLPRLVVLASCQSAGAGATAASADKGAFAALGPSLVREGVPAVLAMQADVFMTTVEEFMPVFFQELARHGQIDQAAAAARRQADLNKRPDSWVPALFLNDRPERVGLRPVAKSEPYPDLVASLADGNCTPILGFGTVEPLVGEARDIAHSLGEAHHFPLALHQREELSQVVQYLVAHHRLVYVRQTLQRYLRREVLRRFGAQLNNPPEDLDELLARGAAALRGRPAFEPHAVLAALPCRVYVTTNADGLMARALADANPPRPPQVSSFDWKNPDKVEEAKLERDPKNDTLFAIKAPLVYHLFGHWQEPRSLALTESDFFDALVALKRGSSPHFNAVRKVLTSSALLFLGFRVDDWNFRVLFQSVMRWARDSEEYPAVAVQIDPERDRTLDPVGARDFLEAHCGKAELNIYWCGLEEFLTRLLEEWKKDPASQGGW